MAGRWRKLLRRERRKRKSGMHGFPPLIIFIWGRNSSFHKEKLFSKRRKLLDQYISVLYTLLSAYVMSEWPSHEIYLECLMAQQKVILTLEFSQINGILRIPSRKTEDFFIACSQWPTSVARVFFPSSQTILELALSETGDTPTIAIFDWENYDETCWFRSVQFSDPVPKMKIYENGNVVQFLDFRTSQSAVFLYLFSTSPWSSRLRVEAA